MIHAQIVGHLLGIVAAVGGADDLLTAFTTGITTNTPVIVGVFGAVIGLVFLLVIGRFILARVRGSVK